MLRACALIGFAAISILSANSSLRAEAVFMPVPIHNVGTGEAFDGFEFVQKAFEVSAIAKVNFIMSLGQLQGMQSTQVLTAGKPVPLSAVQRASDVRKGKTTQAIFAADGIQIQGILVPMSDGSVGQTLHCKNPQSGLVVDAVVLANGSLEVTSK